MAKQAQTFNYLFLFFGVSYHLIRYGKILGLGHWDFLGGSKCFILVIYWVSIEVLGICVCVCGGGGRQGFDFSPIGSSPSLRCNPFPGCGHVCGVGSYAGGEVICGLSLLLTPVGDPCGSFKFHNRFFKDSMV